MTIISISINQLTSVKQFNIILPLEILAGVFFEVSRIPFPDTPWNTRIFWASCSQDSNYCFPVKVTSRKYHSSREKEHSGDVGWVKPGKWGCICLTWKNDLWQLWQLAQYKCIQLFMGILYEHKTLAFPMTLGLRRPTWPWDSKAQM